MRELSRRLQNELAAPPYSERICQGTLLAAAEYLIDVDQWGYRDARLQPNGTMSAAQVEEWTDGVLTGR